MIWYANFVNTTDGDLDGRPMNWRLPVWVGYVTAVVIEAALTGGILLLQRYLPIGRHPALYVLVVALIAYLFGEGPALFATILGLFVYDYFFVLPLHTLFPYAQTSIGWATILAFLLGSSIVSLITISVRRSKQRIEEIADDLRESQKDLNRAQSVACIGNWRLDVRRDELLWSDEVYRIFGTPRGTPMTYEAFLDAVHPDDREYVDLKWLAALRGEPYDIEHRIVVDSNVKWVRERAELEFDEQGRLLGGFGTVQDITEQKETEQALRAEQEHKLAFYQATIMAATNGKLIITDRSEIERITGSAVASWAIRDPADVRIVRHGVEEIAAAAGMEDARIGELLVCAGEAGTNVVKHAKQGEASVHRTENALIVVVSDKGPGIPALALPEVALRRGYSTAGTLGMGYKMMIQLADRVYLATGPEGTTVGIEMRLHPAELQAGVGLMERFEL